MSASPEPAGFLMRSSWRPDAVIADRFELPGGGYAPAIARTRFAGIVAGRISVADLVDATVLISELVTNAVRHGGVDEQQTVVVHVAIAPGVLRVEVCDQGPGFTAPEIPTARSPEGGNGLVLLARMSTRWGVAGDDGTCVWFERELEEVAT